jgi:hypothetical protein
MNRAFETAKPHIRWDNFFRGWVCAIFPTTVDQFIATGGCGETPEGAYEHWLERSKMHERGE